jgi:hypothetical protein
MVVIFKQVDTFNLRRYDGYEHVVYIGMGESKYNHIYGISENGFQFTHSTIAEKFKILSQHDDIGD